MRELPEDEYLALESQDSNPSPCLAFLVTASPSKWTLNVKEGRREWAYNILVFFKKLNIKH